MNGDGVGRKELTYEIAARFYNVQKILLFYIFKLKVKVTNGINVIIR